MGHEAARARFRGRAGQAGGDAPGLDTLRERGQLLVDGHRRGYVRFVRCGGSGGWKSHVPGLGSVESRPSDVPFTVK